MSIRRIIIVGGVSMVLSLMTYQVAWAINGAKPGMAFAIYSGAMTGLVCGFYMALVGDKK